MYVCVCNKVTDKQIRSAMENGARSMDCLKDRLKVASCCGRCQDCAQRVLCDFQVEQYNRDVALAV